ncbi:MAG: hypothetical protein C4527_22490 [Candidatus Omnitrophota bacterium]|nr:MAG: hypothetical protein C4527_22490 [Candidatus Omnitrophota bacterium]
MKGEEFVRLPNGEHAFIDLRKFYDYILDNEHDEGKHKARLFQSVLGITICNVDLLVKALREAARSNEVILGKKDDYGQRFTIDFYFIGPISKAVIRSAWIIRTGEEIPRFVSCYLR